MKKYHFLKKKIYNINDFFKSNVHLHKETNNNKEIGKCLINGVLILNKH